MGKKDCLRAHNQLEYWEVQDILPVALFLYCKSQF